MKPLEMAKLYTEQHLSTNQIGALCQKSGATIQYHLHKLNVPMRDRSDAKMASLGRGDFWNSERLSILERMLDNGRSARDIATILGCGCTKNAVIGKANRMGYFKLPSVSEAAKESAARKSAIGQAQVMSEFRHKTLITFLPESPKLEMAFRAEVAKARESRSFVRMNEAVWG